MIFSQGVAKSFEVNSSDLKTKVLIATQGSDFKDAVVLISTCESATLQPDTVAYLGRANDLDKTILLITSGSGTWKPKDSPIDSISSASRKANVDSLIANILNRLNTILG